MENNLFEIAKKSFIQEFGYAPSDLKIINNSAFASNYSATFKNSKLIKRRKNAWSLWAY
jgi:hypothetical protein